MKRKFDASFSFNISCKLKPIILFCFYILYCINATAQWQWLNPKPSGYNNAKIIFTDHNSGYILNGNGDLYKTTNTGDSWSVVGNYPSVNCLDIKDSTGVMAGYNGALYLSTDNGNNWQLINSGIPDVFETVNIVSRDTIFLSNGYSYGMGYGNIYKTTDRGKTWTSLHCNIPIHSIAFVDSKTGFVGSTQGIIIKTQDGGTTWQQKRGVSFIPSGIQVLQFLNKDTGYAFEEYDSLLITHDGGNSWQSSNAYQPMRSISFVNASDGYLGGENGTLLSTHDGGKTFQDAGFGSNEGNLILSLYFLSKDTGFSVGLSGRIMKTTNGGMSWKAYSPIYASITALSFGDAATGYASSWNNLFKTSDNGNTWDSLDFTTGTQYASQSRFEQCHFTSPDTGFVTSSYPVRVHHTYNGGLTWDTTDPTTVTYYPYDYISEIQFLTANTGFMSVSTGAGFSQGTIVKTTDGGISWQTVWTAPYNVSSYRHIYYVNEDTAYGSDYGQLYKTTDGSKTWNLIYTSTYFYAITSVCFTSSTKGFITNSNGDIIKTNDGGQSWSSDRLSDFTDVVNGQIRSMKFYNSQIGYITTEAGYGPVNGGDIYQTIDSGATWQKTKNTGGTSILFMQDTSVIITGYGGAILKSKIQEAHVDSLKKINNVCSNSFSAVVTAVLSRADSISFEITGTDSTTLSITSTPVFADNERAHCTASTQNLTAGSSYKIRVKYLYKGIYQYSSAVDFIASSSILPVITRTGNVLISNYVDGNQWYRNDSLIASASQQNYTLPAFIAYKQCYTVGVSSVNGCSGVSDSICVDTTSLPAKPILTINGAYILNNVLLTWTTLSELNTEKFIIEKSINGIDFTTTSFAPAAGNSNTSRYYSYTDSVTLQKSSFTIYYRVKTVYKDGSFTYSNIAPVNIPKKNGGFAIAPNPANTNTIIYFEEDVTDASILVFDEFGHKAFSDNFNGVVHSTYQLNTSGLNTGIYIVVVSTNKGNYTSRLVIVH